MSPTFSGLSTAISGLNANKRSLDTISHNISNVNNPYYVRQQVMQASSTYNKLPDGKFSLGSGVRIQQIRQIRDDFLDIKFRDESQEYGYWSSMSSVFEQVEEIFNEVSDNGLQKVMDQFWNGFSELAKKPDNLTIRGLVKERAVAFTETVNHMSQQLDNLQVNLNKDIKNVVNSINSIAKEISNINEKIMLNEVNNKTANDYRDTRNGLLDKLSKLCNIDYYNDASGAINVSIGGKELVSSNGFTELAAHNKGSSFVDIYWKDTIDTPNEMKVNVKRGDISGLLNSRGDVKSTILKGNGSIDNKVDVVIAVDITSSDIDKINDAINNYKEDLKQRGLDPQFKLISFGSGAVTDETSGFQTDFTASLTNGAENTENLNDVINEVINTDFREGSHKKLIVFSDESIDGTGSNTSNSDVNGYIDSLNEDDFSVTIVSKGIYENEGDANEKGWRFITDATGGNFFDIDNVDSSSFAEALSQETTNSTSRHMGNVKDFSEIIPSIKQKLNTFVNTIARNINYVHRKGYSLTGDTGHDFFVPMNSNSLIEAGNIKLNPDLDTLNNIAASSSSDIGNGKIAEQIVSIRETYMFGNLNCDDYYRDIISELGVAANEAAVMTDNQEVIKKQVDDKRKSLSSVSLDEEMTDMLKYQHSYVANTRVVNAIDEMIENIINRMGVVGR